MDLQLEMVLPDEHEKVVASRAPVPAWPEPATAQVADPICVTSSSDWSGFRMWGPMRATNN